jgi:phosphoribosylformylglycinamidine synthase
MWQFERACRGLKDACKALRIPVTGGNVSLYNQTGETAILPTPVVAVLGVIEDVATRTPSCFAGPGERIFVLGRTRAELSGSEWAHVVHGHLGGRPPQADLDAERSLAKLLRAAAGVVTCAHDLSDGGLAQALAEAAIWSGTGAEVALRKDPFVALFSESAARVLVTTHLHDGPALLRLAAEHDVVVTEIGVTGGEVIKIEGQFEIPVAELAAAWRATLPAALEG